MQDEKTYNVLFLCTGNSARSILAETILNQLGRNRFHAFSAGSHPTGQVSPHAIELLREQKMPTDDLRSKSWDEFAKPDSPQLDFVITVCDKAAGEVCPVWPGQPMTAHWGIEDPAAVQGDEAKIQRAFKKAFREMGTRISLFTSLPLDKLDSLSLKRELDAIGKLREKGE
jgi:arsenate reductase (thioredoxin)